MDFIDLGSLGQFQKEQRYTIDSKTDRVALTTRGKCLIGSIYVEPRDRDLTITISDFILNSKEDITLDIRQGASSLHNNLIYIEGHCRLESTENTAVAVAHQQKVSFLGNGACSLVVMGGYGCTAIGDESYCKHSGRIIFGGTGKISIKSRDWENSKESKGRSGGNGIQFNGDSSGVIVKDQVEVMIKGGAGEVNRSAKIAAKSGDGGAAIQLMENASIDVFEEARLTLQGGDGASSICTDYLSSTCGNGAYAVLMGSGIIHLKGDVVLIGGNGGKQPVDQETIPADGGGCICLTSEQEKETVLDLGEGVRAFSGNGGVRVYKEIQGTKAQEEYIGRAGCFLNAMHRKFHLAISENAFQFGKGERQGGQIWYGEEQKPFEKVEEKDEIGNELEIESITEETAGGWWKHFFRKK